MWNVTVDLMEDVLFSCREVYKLYNLGRTDFKEAAAKVMLSGCAD